MIVHVLIAPQERYEAMEAYRQWLTAEQENEIKDAPEGAYIRLCRDRGDTSVIIMEVDQLSWYR